VGSRLTTETGETTEIEGIACAAGVETTGTTDATITCGIVGVSMGVCQSELPFTPPCALAFFIPIDAIMSHKIKISFFILLILCLKVSKSKIE